MEVRDPVHGSIHILDEEAPILRHEFFQRLRNIKQLGFSEYVFPGATHNRFIHSIGVMSIGAKAFDSLFKHHSPSADLLRLKETFKLACLLHDVGHAPLSHSTETVMPSLSSLKIPTEFLSDKDRAHDRQATHEDYTIKSIADSSFASSFKQVEESFGVQRLQIADLIVGKTSKPEYFTIGGLNYFSLLHQLVSSELDCDRMDYLLRDSYFCGVSYGSYDLDWLLDNLMPCEIDGSVSLGISERAVVTFDDFLLSRYHMFIMVYFHYRSVCLEQLLFKYFKTSPEEYTIPADIEAYIEHDDHHLMKIMRKSKNPYAQDIVKNQIPLKIYESFNPKQTASLEKIQQFLVDNDIEFIRCSSASRLSKYYNEQGLAPYTSSDIKVVRKLYEGAKPLYSSINEATDLFKKFSESHSIDRLHCNLDTLSKGVREKIIAMCHKEH
jgi:uncharacterized protein